MNRTGQEAIIALAPQKPACANLLLFNDAVRECERESFVKSTQNLFVCLFFFFRNMSSVMELKQVIHSENMFSRGNVKLSIYDNENLINSFLGIDD